MLLQVVTWLSVALGACGCDTLIYGFGPHPRSPRYAVAFTNRTEDRLHDVRAEWVERGVGYAPSAGILVPGATKIITMRLTPFRRQLKLCGSRATDVSRAGDEKEIF